MVFNQVLSLWRARKQEKVVAARLYAACVAQARRSDLFVSLGLSDDIQTRFEFITAHLWLVLRSLRAAGKRGVGRKIAAHFFSTLDGSLRESGEGDLAVPRRMKMFAMAFYGRLAAYDKALAQGELGAALAHNFPTADKLNSYFTEQLTHFESVSPADIEEGNLFHQKES